MTIHNLFVCSFWHFEADKAPLRCLMCSCVIKIYLEIKIKSIATLLCGHAFIFLKLMEDFVNQESSDMLS